MRGYLNSVRGYLRTYKDLHSVMDYLRTLNSVRGYLGHIRTCINSVRGYLMTSGHIEPHEDTIGHMRTYQDIQGHMRHVVLRSLKSQYLAPPAPCASV